MKDKRYLSAKTGIIFVMLLLCLCLNVEAAPSVEGDTKLTAVTDEVITAEYTITNDEDMESVSLTISYDKNVLNYVSGSGGNSFLGNGGNGSVQLSSKPGSKSASFAVKFKGRSDGDTSLEILACTITVKGQEVNVLNGQNVPDEDSSDDTGEEDGEEKERASWIVDERTFYLHRPEMDIEGFNSIKIDIQGVESRVLKHESLDVYVIMLFSDNGSYRDYFVYNPDTGNVIPFVEMESGTDHVIIVEPEDGIHIPTRYVPVDMGWGPKYTIPAYKHVIIDGIDEFLDDTNRYLIYGINQDGEKAWYSYDYDKNSLQLFDDVAYQGEQNYIASLEESVEGQKSEASHLLKQYNRDMGRRLTIILIMTIMIIVLLNVTVILYLRMKKMRMPEPEEEHEPINGSGRSVNAYVTGNLEENETDFQEPFPEDGEEEDEIELEIIDLDELEDDD